MRYAHAVERDGHVSFVDGDARLAEVTAWFEVRVGARGHDAHLQPVA